MILFWSMIALLLFVAAGFIFYALRCTRVVAAALILVLSSLALLTYLELGASQPLATQLFALAHKDEMKAIAKRLQHPAHVIALIAQHLQEKPSDAKGWHLLGKLYLRQGNPKRASAALEKAHALRPHDLAISFTLLEAQAAASNGAFSKATLATAMHILKRQPEHPLVLNLLAINAYRQHHFHEAANLWERILSQLPPESREAKAVMRAIRDSERHSKPV